LVDGKGVSYAQTTV